MKYPTLWGAMLVLALLLSACGSAATPTIAIDTPVVTIEPTMEPTEAPTEPPVQTATPEALRSPRGMATRPGDRRGRRPST